MLINCLSSLGLLSTEEVDKFEASLEVAEPLIRSRPDGITEVSFSGGLGGRCVLEDLMVSQRSVFQGDWEANVCLKT